MTYHFKRKRGYVFCPLWVPVEQAERFKRAAMMMWFNRKFRIALRHPDGKLTEWRKPHNRKGE